MIRNFGAAGAYTSTGHTDKLDGVDCTASHCYYNKNGKTCTAEHIQVGTQNATSTEDTVCATFRPE